MEADANNELPESRVVKTDWNRLIDDHGRAVFGVACRILGEPADAEDVVQEVFMEAQRVAASKKIKNWAAFLKRLAAFRSLDRLRQRKQTVPLDESFVADDRGNPQKIAMKVELDVAIRNAIAQLPQQQAAVLYLRYFENLSYQQIAQTLRVSQSAVGTALGKARCQLKVLLHSHAEESSR